MDAKMQNPFRILAAKKLQQIFNSDSHQNVMHKQQAYTIKSINDKLMAENAIIVKADKGKTSVILYSDDYTEKVHTFLNDNFQTIQTNPTDIFQKLLNKKLQQCNLIVNKNQIKYLLQKKPQVPTLKAQIKMHKPGNPIRPAINNMNAPAYEISKYLANKLNEYLNPEHQFTTKNSINLAEDLTKLKINGNYRMLTYDIKDLYVNIPTKEKSGLSSRYS
jgi:hypothetical protein